MLVFLAGLSRAGKTRLAQEVVSRDPRIQHVRASALLMGGDRPLHPADVAEADANQEALIETVAECRSTWGPSVVFDGHALIETAAGSALVPSRFFDVLAPDAIVAVTATPSEIAQRREIPAGSLTLRALANLQELESSHAEEEARRLGVPFVSARSGDSDMLLAMFGPEPRQAVPRL